LPAIALVPLYCDSFYTSAVKLVES